MLVSNQEFDLPVVLLPFKTFFETQMQKKNINLKSHLTFDAFKFLVEIWQLFDLLSGDGEKVCRIKENENTRVVILQWNGSNRAVR